jgi:hypothetical protein
MAQTGRVLSFLGARRSSNDWTQQELAEFYRVESSLLQNGLLVVTDREVFQTRAIHGLSFACPKMKKS